MSDLTKHSKALPAHTVRFRPSMFLLGMAASNIAFAQEVVNIADWQIITPEPVLSANISNGIPLTINNNHSIDILAPAGTNASGVMLRPGDMFENGATSFTYSVWFENSSDEDFIGMVFGFEPDDFMGTGLSLIHI